MHLEPADGGERVETNLPTGAVEYHKLKDYYVTYAAFPGEKPVITGALPVGGWKQNGKIWTARFEGDTAEALIVNGQNQTLAREPNHGYFIPPAVSQTPEQLYFGPGQLKKWRDMTANRVIMLLRWHTAVNSLVSIDEKKGVAELSSSEEGVMIVPPRYYVENVKALLDEPGEWFFDNRLHEISYIPPADIGNPNHVSAGVAVLANLIKVQGTVSRPVRNLRFYGLTFEAAKSPGNAITYRFAHGCEIKDCTVRSCAGTGISVQTGCYQTRILNNRFENIQDGAVVVQGPLNPTDGREITRETQISYNKLFDCGGHANIAATYTLMTTISHNYITRTHGRFAIDVGGWANLEEAIDGGYRVEYNHLDDVLEDADDAGAIKTAGVTFNSVVRRNLIHDVHAGFFNENAGFWFDNLSKGWKVEQNIYYHLEQSEWKLCAAMIEDNIYRDNFTIKAPVHEPQMIIEGEPQLKASNLKIEASAKTSSGAIVSGSIIHLSADVINNGATGMAPVALYIDGKVKLRRLFAVIRNNRRSIEFDIRLYDEGEHRLAIGSTAYQTIRIAGKKPAVVFENFLLSDSRVILGEPVSATALARNLTPFPQTVKVTLFVDNDKILNRSVELKPNESREVRIELEPAVGHHRLHLANSAEQQLDVVEGRLLDLTSQAILQYGSPRAKPYKIEMDTKANRFQITAGGSDFFHAEDSYAAAYVRGIKGDFVATVKIDKFGGRTHQWFRAGLFVRNDITQSFNVQPGSKGSVLVFTTPARAGIEYDEFGDGCMHKASSTNLPENQQTPIYLKIVRHGNSFSGYISVDGKNWIIERRTSDIPGIAAAVDLGLAAGAPDKRQYQAQFSDWKIEVAE